MASRVVVIIDPDSGAVIDVAGNKRETGRYAKFIKRMLSLDKNPTLNYGYNGGDTLVISKNGNSGKAVIVKADSLDVSGTVKSNGQTVEQIATTKAQDVLNTLYGTDGEIDITTQIDPATRQLYVQVSLNSTIVNQLSAIERDLNQQEGAAGSYVKKSELAEAIEDISIEEDDDLEAVKTKFGTLLENLAALAGVAGSGSSDPEE